MTVLRRLFGLMVLLPSLVHAATLEIPGPDAHLSGVGVISGWKCEADGEITIRLNNGAPLPATYGLPRTDTMGVCNNAGNNGFFSYWNWGNLGDGEHTAVAYDNGVEFARSTFRVTTPGTAFLTGASKRVTVEDFPLPGETTVLEWNEATQHFEMVEFMGGEPMDMGDDLMDMVACVEGLTLYPGEMCSGSLMVFGYEVDFTFAVNADGQGCIEVDVPPDFPVGVPEIPCFDTDQEFEDFLTTLVVSGASATKNDDGSWTINSFPADL